MYSAILLLFLFIPTYSYSVCISDRDAVFEFERTTVLDTIATKKRAILPRMFGNDLWVLVNEAKEIDSASGYYMLHRIHDSVSYRLVLPATSMYRQHIVEYFIEEDRIILIGGLSILMFEKQSEFIWELEKEHRLSSIVFHAKKEADSIYMWMDMITSLRGEKGDFYCLTFDLKTEREIGETVLPEPAGSAFMYIQPRNILDRTAQTIAISDVTSYSIRVYNADLSECETLIRQPDTWVQSAEVSVSKKTPQRSFPKLDSLRRASSLMTRVTLINDTTLLALWSTPKSKGGNQEVVEFYADIWTKKNGKWTINKRDMPTNGYGESYSCALQDASISINYIYSNGEFLDLAAYPLDYDFKYTWRSEEEYQTASDRYFAVNPLRYIVVARKFNFSY